MIYHSSKAKQKLTFDDLVKNDNLGLFDGIKVGTRKSSVQKDAASELFAKINAFIAKHAREPMNSDDFEETKLARGLAKFRKQSELANKLHDMDEYGLLNDFLKSNEVEETNQINKIFKEAPSNIDDVFSSGLFDDASSDIFQLKHVTQKREKPEEIAKRKPCPDFEKYIPFFEELDRLVENREVDIKRFSNVQQIKKGDIFISGGLYCFVADVGEYRENNDGRYDPRLRVIYSNGTESNLLLWSLGKSLYEDPNGKQIIRGVESIYEQFNVDKTPDGSVKTGEIYFLKSLSERSEIQAIPNLIKIGVTTGSTYKRIENADTEKTYLEAPVEVLKILPCYNLNVKNLEKLIHSKLHDRRKSIKITSPGGGVYTATEWFDVHLDEALNVVKSLLV